MINLETLACVTDHFNSEYFNIHQKLMENGTMVASRNGATIEFLNFKTVIQNPVKRCVGGYKRNINVFFLLAEALWIFSGRKDVLFLDTFNSQLKQYSDDQQVYHAPYGWRLRKWGVSSENNAVTEENKHAYQTTDQLVEAVKMLDVNPEDRRVVLSIWNPDLDLNIKSKDIPCNDILMYKIRNGQLYSTIANRSNDLNLGLTTNVFQFSFIGEIVSKILGVGLGDQVHNSQSLHLYLDHPLTGELNMRINDVDVSEFLLYDSINSINYNCKAIEMDFNFASFQNVEAKFKLIDFHVNSIISILLNKINNPNNETINSEEFGAYLESLKQFSRYFYFIYKLLDLYVDYKQHKVKGKAMHALVGLTLELPEFENSDYTILALNFFTSRIVDQSKVNVIEQIRETWPSAVNTGNW